jgi:mono/diheme cytochrome c family protein
MNYINISMLALALCLPGTALAVDIEALTAECESCHGPDGVSAHSDVPSISGQSKDYLDDSLHSFQVWGRPCIKTLYRQGDHQDPLPAGRYVAAENRYVQNSQRFVR